MDRELEGPGHVSNSYSDERGQVDHSHLHVGHCNHKTWLWKGEAQPSYNKGRGVNWEATPLPIGYKARRVTTAPIVQVKRAATK